MLVLLVFSWPLGSPDMMVSHEVSCCPEIGVSYCVHNYVTAVCLHCSYAASLFTGASISVTGYRIKTFRRKKYC